MVMMVVLSCLVGIVNVVPHQDGCYGIVTPRLVSVSSGLVARLVCGDGIVPHRLMVLVI